MRILLKILLFPVVLVLTVLVAFCRFVCLFSGMILGIVAVLLFLIGLLVLFAGRMDGFIGFMILAWLVSPYGLPMAASWLTERVADFNVKINLIHVPLGAVLFMRAASFFNIKSLCNSFTQIA